MSKLIVNVALTGCVAHKADNPALPITPEEVAADAKRCADLGATIFHVHARNERGCTVSGAGYYRPYVQAVRAAVPGAVVCVSCSGRHGQGFEERADALLAGPDMGSLTLGSVDFESGTAVNDRRTVRALARRMKDLGIAPECEAFDTGHIRRFILDLADEGLVTWNGWLNFIYGPHLPYSLMAATTVLYTTVTNLWAWGGVGSNQWPANKGAVDAGGHVRTGMEDNLLMKRGAPATNMSLVERVVEYGRAVGREPATIEETRIMLGLKGEMDGNG